MQETKIKEINDRLCSKFQIPNTDLPNTERKHSFTFVCKQELLLIIFENSEI